MDCDHLIHPFQNDPGVSQHQRMMEDLLSGSAKIDGRTLADLLDYFAQLSRHINYYDETLQVSNWQPFFDKSIPFSLAAIIKYKKKPTGKKFDRYQKLFAKNPSRQSLQLGLNYFFYSSIKKINTWHLQVKDSGLPIEQILERIIKDKLSLPLRKFICLTNIAVSKYCVRRIDFSKIARNEIWNLDAAALVNADCSIRGRTKRARLEHLMSQVKDLFPVFQDTITVISTSAEMSIEKSLDGLKEELKERHPPHLALLFAFLKLFKYLQDDLNGFTRKHLDFFYKDILKIIPRPSVGDKAHLVFEIQKQLDKYLLKQGLLAKDGKDDNKEEVYFALDDEIVVNKAQVADRRTLFLNNKTVYDATYLEGVYMAPDASKADGVEIDFTEEPKNVPTLGAKNSKYVLPETKLFKPYPAARLGFIMASPVLLLNEGTRTIDITLACRFETDHCSQIAEPIDSVIDSCCEGSENGEIPGKPVVNCGPQFIPSDEFYSKVNDVLQQEYYYVSEELIQKATKKGIAPDLIKRLKEMLVIQPVKKLCYCPVGKTAYDKVVPAADFELVFTADERKILCELFKPRRAFRIYFSGEKEWIEPTTDVEQNFEQKIELIPVPPGGKHFRLHINVVLDPDKPAVTFFKKDALKEDLDTELPLIKIELDDAIKIVLEDDQLKGIIDSLSRDRYNCCPENKDCCVLKDPVSSEHHFVSLYHFFRDVFVVDQFGGEKTRIDVSVCGLKNLIVQNDESVQDVNRPIYPFGTMPKVGASFYVGSKELFSKEWTKVFVNAEWKDKPKDFGIHYTHYSYKNTTFEDGSKEIVNSSFLTTAYVLDKGNWQKDGQRRLFKFLPGEQARTKPLPPGFPPVPPKVETPSGCQGALPDHVDVYDYTTAEFAGLTAYKRRQDLLSKLLPYNVSSQYGFLRFTLDGISFQYEIFPFVLARHLMAYAGLLSLDVIQELVTKADGAKKIIDQMIIKINDINTHVGHIQGEIGNITTHIGTINTQLGFIQGNLASAIGNIPGNLPQAAADIGIAVTNANNINTALTGLTTERNNLQQELTNFILHDLLDNPGGPFDPNNSAAYGIIRLAAELRDIIQFFVDNLQVDPELKDGLPSEPYVPVIKTMSIDYTATAAITDIDLIHLYPFKDTYKHEQITMRPTLFPTFCDEGNLYIGLKDLVPGSNLNVLFQLAEATADSEAERERLRWFYLDNNQWKKLRTGFEVVDDATDGLTTSGIVKFALPANMTKDNSVMPKGLHWIKAGIQEKSRSVSETIGIHTQAISVTFTNEVKNDKLRLSKPLEAGKISKLKAADASVKKISQPYESFGGRVPEIERQFYIRVSEQLRHKGRAIQKFDYERLALEQFPQLFKVKCVNHSFALDASQFKNDFPVSPGYVILAVIPDLNQLKAGKSFEPKAPVSLLEKIKDYLSLRTSPFVRLRVMNPRYEKINFCMKIKLQPGKDVNYYQEKLRQDLSEFLAPWAIGDYGKLSFGQCVNRSDIIRFLEERDYLDYIIELAMGHEFEKDINGDPDISPDRIEVCPKTPRSILIAGEIDICIERNDCEKWGEGDCGNRRIKVIDYCND